MVTTKGKNETYIRKKIGDYWKIIGCIVFINILSSSYVSGTGSESKIAEDNRFTTGYSLKSLNTIRESLESLKAIIIKSENEEPIILKNFKHTDWEMQNSGIPNSLISIEGTIRKQKYLISKLKYKLETQKNTSSNARREYLKKQMLVDKKNYQEYLNTTQIVD